MRIEISEKNRAGFCLRLPTGLVLSRPTAALIAGQLRKRGVQISAKKLCLFIKAVRAYQKDHPGWQLVEVQSANGELVKIEL